MLASLVVAMILPGSHAGHGLDNNWTVAITGMKDANDCLRVSSIEDLGANLANPAKVDCLSATSTCTDNYDCDAAKAKKPANFAGCTFDSSSASAVTMVGVLMDGLCHDNFVVEQKNFNGAPGLAQIRCMCAVRLTSTRGPALWLTTVQQRASTSCSTPAVLVRLHTASWHARRKAAKGQRRSSTGSWRPGTHAAQRQRLWKRRHQMPACHGWVLQQQRLL